MSIIHVADSHPTNGATFRGRYTSSLPTLGAAGLVVVNLEQIKSLAQLSAALAAAGTDSSRTGRIPVSGQTGVKDRSESTERATGPFTSAGFDSPNPAILMVEFRNGWSTATAALSLKQGPNFGPHAVAIIVDLEAAGFAGTFSTGVAAAVQALTGRLS
jgi:hypothetical protein